jgi:hypothetical protein
MDMSAEEERVEHPALTGKPESGPLPEAERDV